MGNKLSVRLYDIPIGILEINDKRKLHFTYLHFAKTSLSHSMPLKERSFDHAICKAYFGGLIPDNLYKLYSKDIFSFLEKHGNEVRGAISFHSISEPIQDEKKERGLHSLYDIVQNDNPTMIYQQYFYMKVAKYLGLYILDFKLLKDKSHPKLQIKRPDRVLIDNQVKKLNQEDLCQVLGIERDKGPRYAALFDCLKFTTVPARERNRFIKMIMFNTKINNTHAQARSYILVETQNNHWELGPISSIYCDQNLRNPMPIKIGNAIYSHEIKDADWQLFCEKIHYNYSIFKSMLANFHGHFLEAVKKAKQDFKDENLPF